MLEEIIINLVYILFPLMFYLIYVAYNKNFQNERIKNIYLDLSLYTSLYLYIRNGNIEFMLYIIPLIIMFIKNRDNQVIYTMIFLVTFFKLNTNITLIALIIEFIIYYAAYIIKMKCNLRNDRFICGIILLKLGINLLYNYNNINLVIYGSVALICITFILFYIIYKSDNIINVHMNMQDLEHEKELRKSLFKITHEIKNPLAVCKGYLEMFNKENKKHIDEYIPVIKSEINRTLTIINDYLDISKIKLNFDILDVELLLDDVFYCMKDLLNSKNIILQHEKLDEEVYISGDYDRLKQVLINLIKNSFEALETKDSGLIDMWYELKNNKVNIFIKDNGCGIHENDLSKIFEAFYTSKKNGTGLGMCLCKEIIDGHNAIITYKSKENQGCMVNISFNELKF